MSILVIAEHDNEELKPSTLNVVTAAKEFGEAIDILVMGENCQKVSKQAASIQNINKVYCMSDAQLKNHLAEPLTAGTMQIVKGDSYKYIMSPASTFGKNLLPRISALLDVQQISDVTEVVSASSFKRPVYGGQAIATVESNDDVKVITVRVTAFDAAEAEGGQAQVTEVAFNPTEDFGSTFVRLEVAQSERPELTGAARVVSGGRALGSKENFKMIEDLADKLGAAIGASRAAVDAGYVPNDYQVGQTGKVVAPELYIAVGISGAIQHLAGMKDSKTIVAINKDEDAPIFQIADYGVVGDLFDILPELTEKL